VLVVAQVIYQVQVIVLQVKEEVIQFFLQSHQQVVVVVTVTDNPLHQNLQVVQVVVKAKAQEQKVQEILHQ
jgi:MinD-like ATPase involved in chromosome partitioning or flagellar assembly